LLLLILAAAVYGLKVLRRPGVSAGIFFAGYGLARALVELVREPDAHMPDFPLGLTMGMMLSLPMALIGFLLILRGFRTERQKEQAS
jgi:phosphatidylglycerol:prolipoprotein diacylglycerol transferase